MNKRYLLAAVLFTIGFLLLIGAVGSLECGEIGYKETFVRCSIGMVLIFAAFPVSGNLPFQKKNRR